MTRFAPAAPTSYSPMQLSLKLLKNLGYVSIITEANMRIHREDEEDLVYKKDLFGFVDIVSLKPNTPTLGVQTTSLSNVSARIRKIQSSVWFEWIKQSGHWHLQVHGWDLETPGGGVRVVNMLGKDADGKWLYATEWSSLVPKGRRSKKRPCKQVEIPL